MKRDLLSPCRSRHPWPHPVLERNDHLIEVDLLIIEVADSATLEDVQPDRPDMEIVVSGNPKDHVRLLIAEHPIDLALDHAVCLTRGVHLHVHFDAVPSVIQQDTAVTDTADGITRNRLTCTTLPSKPTS